MKSYYCNAIPAIIRTCYIGDDGPSGEWQLVRTIRRVVVQRPYLDLATHCTYLGKSSYYKCKTQNIFSFIHKLSNWIKIMCIYGKSKFYLLFNIGKAIIYCYI